MLTKPIISLFRSRAQREKPRRVIAIYKTVCYTHTRSRKPKSTREPNHHPMIELSSQNVLVVDDSQLAREIIIKMLSKLDIHVTPAQSGEEAIHLLQQQPYALVLLDVMMDGISGIETASRIRALDHENSDVPIIFITATSTDTMFEGYEAGAVDYLLKPVEPITLCSKVNIFCRLHTQRDTIQQQLQEIQHKNEELEHYIEEINVLRALVPICAACKNIRDDTGYWHSIEKYFAEHGDTKFSHSICPECSEKLYPKNTSKESST